MARTTIPVAVTSLGSNTRTVSVAVTVPNVGWVTAIQPIINPAGPRGRYYVRVCLVALGPNSDQVAQGAAPASALQLDLATIAVLWAGYVCPGCPASLPAFRTDPGTGIVLDWTSGTNGAATDQLVCSVTVEDKAPIQSPFLFVEQPGSGQGELVVTAQPGGGNTGGTGDVNSGGTGTPPVHKLIPAGVRWRFLGIAAHLATSAVAGNRMIEFDVQSFGGAEFCGGGADSTIPPSVTVNVRGTSGRAIGAKTPQSTEANTYSVSGWGVRAWVPEGEFAGQQPNFNATGAVASTGMFWLWRTWNIDPTATTGDVYTGVRLGVEEWACPIP